MRRIARAWSSRGVSWMIVFDCGIYYLCERKIRILKTNLCIRAPWYPDKGKSIKSNQIHNTNITPRPPHWLFSIHFFFIDRRTLSRISLLLPTSRAAKDRTYHCDSFLLLLFIFSFSNPICEPKLDVLITLAASAFALASLRSATFLGSDVLGGSEGALDSGSAGVKW
jgi:hypothetical protein